MKKIVAVLLLLILLSYSCRKELNKVELDFGFSPNMTLNIGDRIYMPYSVTGKNIDSICLFVNNQLYISKQRVSDSMIFYAHQAGHYNTYLRVYHHGGLYIEENGPEITINEYIDYQFDMLISAFDGSDEYFIGNALQIELISEYDDIDIDKLREVNLILDYGENQHKETKTKAPFVFRTPIITSGSVKIKFDILTEHYRKIEFEKILVLEQDEPPTISFLNGNNVKRDHVSFDSVYLSIKVRDNYRIDQVEIFANDALVKTIEPWDDFYYEEVYFSDLLIGENEFYVIATDNNGNRLESGHQTTMVHSAIMFDGYIRDHVRVNGSPDQVFLTNSQLVFIDSQTEKLIKTVDLPKSFGKALAYNSDNQRLYIGINEGAIFFYDLNTNQFGSLFDYHFEGITDLEVDLIHDRLIIVHNNQISVARMSENKWFTLDIDFDNLTDHVYFAEDENLLVTNRYGFYDYHFFKIGVDDQSYLVHESFDMDRSPWICKHPVSNTFFWEAYEYNLDLEIVADCMGKEMGAYQSYSEDGEWMYFSDYSDYEIEIYSSESYQRIHRESFEWKNRLSFAKFYQTSNARKPMMVADPYYGDYNCVVFIELESF
jgi:hypothetical protein